MIFIVFLYIIKNNKNIYNIKKRICISRNTL
jgi:hypothetical protein